MLNRDEKILARNFFKLLIHEANGSVFEDIFTDIMNYAEPDFQQIKPYGNIGDRKNDGYIRSKGIYFQVYAPENINLKTTEAISKLKTDFSGLLSQWQNVKEFYFVINDKYRGTPPDIATTLDNLITENKLVNGGVLTAKDLENKLFSLEDDQILKITGNILDPSKIQHLDFGILGEVIAHIMSLTYEEALPPDIKLPDWDKKIKFNGLSETTAQYLKNGYFQIHSLQKYLDNNSNFLADELRDKMNEIYINEKKKYSGDELFLAIAKKASPSNKIIYQTAVIIIMSKYFETCDIFEAPKEEDYNDSAN